MPFRVAFASFFLLLVSLVLLTAFRTTSIKRPENGDGGPATSAPINGPTAISIDQNGNLYVVELVGRTVRKIVAKTGLIETIAGNGKDCCFEEGKGAASTALFAPIEVTVDRNGDVYVADTSSHIRLVHATTGIATTVISELEGMDADKPGVAPSLPKYEHVDGLAFDSLGALYIAGSAHGKIYTVSHGVISEFAGFGGHGYGDGKTAREAQFNFPMGIAFGPIGDLFIADYENCRIRKVDKASNMVSTVAGTGQCSSSGDGGNATRATVNHPSAIAVDSDGNIYFNDAPPSCVRRIDGKTSLISSIPWTCEPKPGKTGQPSGLAIDKDGNLYVTEYGSNVVVRIDGKTQKIETVGGNGLPDRIDEQM